MTTETAKMIFADKQIAQDILGKLMETTPDTLYDLFQLPTGWQVVRVKQCPPKTFSKETAMPITWNKKKAKPTADAPSAQPAAASQTADVFSFLIKVKKESKEWFNLAEPLPNTTSVWLAKATLVKSELVYPASNTWEFTVPMALAKKKGWNKPVAQAAPIEAAPVETAPTAAPVPLIDGDGNHTTVEGYIAEIEALHYA